MIFIEENDFIIYSHVISSFILYRFNVIDLERIILEWLERSIFIFWPMI